MVVLPVISVSIALLCKLSCRASAMLFWSCQRADCTLILLVQPAFQITFNKVLRGLSHYFSSSLPSWIYPLLYLFKALPRLPWFIPSCGFVYWSPLFLIRVANLDYNVSFLIFSVWTLCPLGSPLHEFIHLKMFLINSFWLKCGVIFPVY